MIEKSNCYKVVNVETGTIVAEGNAKAMRSVIKGLNHESPRSHFVGISHGKRVGEKWN